MMPALSVRNVPGRISHSDGLGHIRGNRANLRVRHQAARAEDLAELADDAHGIRRGDDHVEIQVATC